MDGTTSGRDPIESLAEEFLARRRRGERPAVEEFATRHPDLASLIRAVLPAMVLVDDLDADLDATAGGAAGAAVPPPAPGGDLRVVPEVRRGRGSPCRRRWATSGSSARWAGAGWGWSTRPSRSRSADGWP